MRPEVNGKINKLPVDIGDIVKQGDLLFSWKITTCKPSENRRNGNRTRQSAVGAGQRNYVRAQQLFDSSSFLKSFSRTRKPNLTWQKARWNEPKNRSILSRQAEKDCDRRSVRLHGVDQASLGRQAVSESGGFSSGTEVLTIANLNEMIINAHINQADVSRLRSVRSHCAGEAVRV